MLDFESVSSVSSDLLDVSVPNTAALRAGTLSPKGTKAAPMEPLCLRVPSVATTTPSSQYAA